MAIATDFKFGRHIVYVEIISISAKLGHMGQKLGHMAVF